MKLQWLVENKEQEIENAINEQNKIKEQIVGELEDMILDISMSKDNIKDTIINYFNEYYKSDLVKEDIMNIQLIGNSKN